MPRDLPDPDLNLRDCADYILNSRLGRKAMLCSRLEGLSVFIRDLLESIFRLAQSCHLPEFTDHGILHLCSLVGRMSDWTCLPDQRISRYLCDTDSFNSEHAAVLMVATLVHDIGMLSQTPDDLPQEFMEDLPTGPADIPDWVRRTHVHRLERLIQRLFQHTQHEPLISHELIQSAIRVARAHQNWPWEYGFSDLPDLERGLAAVLAVSDLLDEDANRCDTKTLVRHRQGTLLNLGHWLRHSLTRDRIQVYDGVVRVRLARPPGTDASLAPVFAALRNHFRLTMLYLEPLGLVGAGLLRVEFEPPTGCPEQIAENLEGWHSIPPLVSQHALSCCLMSSFLPMAVSDESRVGQDDLARTRDLQLEEINLDSYARARGIGEVRSPYEQSIRSILPDE